MAKGNKIIKGFKKDLSGKTVRQTAILFSSQTFALLLRTFVGVLNTRVLGPVGYGTLSFFLTFTSFTVLFFRFGFFSASGLLIAQAKEESKEKELTGASVIIAFFVGVSYSFFILLSSFFIDDIFNTNIGWILRYTSFLLIALPFTLLIPQIGRGTNKIEKLSIFNIIPKLVYLLGALMLLHFIQIEPFHFILLNIAGTLIGVLVVIRLFQPVFNNIRKNCKAIWNKTKEYGFHLYLGQIADQSTYQLDGILIAYFINTTQLGYYSLAVAVTLPMVGLSTALSTSLFKGFVERDRIPKKVIYYNFLWLAVCVVGLVTFGKFIVVLLFTEKFLPTVPLILPLALAGFFQGMYQPYLNFVVLKADGKTLRNIAISCAVINLLFNMILIPLYGTYGAAIASLISVVVWYAMLTKLYRKIVHR